MQITEDIYKPPNDDSNNSKSSSSPESKYKRKSKLGLISFFLGLFCQVGLLVMIALSAIQARNLQNENYDQHYFQLIGFIGIAFFALSFISLLVGIISLFKRNIDKTYSILGVTLSSQVIGIGIFFVFLGLYLSNYLNTPS